MPSSNFKVKAEAWGGSDGGHTSVRSTQRTPNGELALVSIVLPRAHFKAGGDVRLLWQGVIYLL